MADRAVESGNVRDGAACAKAPYSLIDDDPEVICPSCGRFVGTYEKCPYCGARIHKRMSVRLFRWASVVIAVVGLFLLWVVARRIEAPLVKAADVTPTMNMAMVRVRGVLAADPRLHPVYGSFNVPLRDSSGVFTVTAYSDVASSILRGSDPHRGDEIEVTGLLRLGRGKRVIVNSPRHFKVLRRGASRRVMDAAIAELDPSWVGRNVRLRGRLEAARRVGPGWKGKLCAPDASIAVWIYDSDLPSLGAEGRRLLLEGAASVEVVGRIKLFRRRDGEQELEILPARREGALKALPGGEVSTPAPKERDGKGGAR